jgi:DMSO/TMAO reductase YedYZ molybdopterin-dependent catalytic subunit
VTFLTKRRTEPIAQPFLLTKRLHPENQETPIHFVETASVSERLFYIRNHFAYPELSTDAWRLCVNGAVWRPTVFFYEQLLAMPAKTIQMTLECAGNKREYFEPPVYGEQWRDGAINQGSWTGVPLAYLFSQTGLQGGAMEAVFIGRDCGKRPDQHEIVPYSRSLPIAKALHPDTLIAYLYNGRPITYKHGYPMRLIVPGWYGMASVKWLQQITVIDHFFEGPFQSIDYNYYPQPDSDAGKNPVTTIRVNSIIQQPLDLAILPCGPQRMEGIAWTGTGEITKLEVSTDGGHTWQPARLERVASEPYAWTRWSLIWHAVPGEHVIMARAYDSAGHYQPLLAAWNRKGYGYNAIAQARVKVESS